MIGNMKYYKLNIDTNPNVDIWIGDAEGNFVQKGVGKLQTSLLPGSYTVEFGLGNKQHLIRLEKDTSIRYDVFTTSFFEV
jgi:hypothetical protein